MLETNMVIANSVKYDALAAMHPTVASPARRYRRRRRLLPGRPSWIIAIEAIRPRCGGMPAGRGSCLVEHCHDALQGLGRSAPGPGHARRRRWLRRPNAAPAPGPGLGLQWTSWVIYCTINTGLRIRPTSYRRMTNGTVDNADIRSDRSIGLPDAATVPGMPTRLCSASTNRGMSCP